MIERAWCNQPECTRPDHVIGHERTRGRVLAFISQADVAAIEALSDAAIRSGDTQTAIQGYALALRLREEAKRWRAVT